MEEVRLFLVRVWRRLHDGVGFRASVRALDRDQPLVFSRPEQVAEFLRNESDPTPPDSGHGDRDAPCH